MLYSTRGAQTSKTLVTNVVNIQVSQVSGGGLEGDWRGTGGGLEAHIGRLEPLFEALLERL